MLKTLNFKSETLASRIEARAAAVGVCGMGYVGVPLAATAARAGFRVLGFDIDTAKITSLNDGRSYIDAVTTHLPDATLVFDRFHVIKLYNDKLSDLRRDLYRQLADTMQKDVLKGVRWLLLKRPENLDASRREPERLREALLLNEPLAVAYHLKEELNEIWEQDDQASAQALLMDWIVYAESTGIRMLKQFAKTLRFHAFGILAWYDYPISTGPLEGTNNKIKTMKRQAYGFRDAEFLKLKILGINETTYALVG